MSQSTETTGSNRDRLSRRYHRSVARQLASMVLDPGQRILLVEPPHPVYLEAFPAEHLTVLVSTPEQAERLTLASSGAEIQVGDVLGTPLEGPFDHIVLPEILSNSTRLWEQLRRIRQDLCSPTTRLLLVHYSFLWQPVVKAAQYLGWRRHRRPQNWLAPSAVAHLLNLAGIDPIRLERFNLIPLRLGRLVDAVNRYLAPLPLVQHLCFNHVTVARSRPAPNGEELSVTVVVPTRNERGNIRAAVEGIPRLGRETEILFIDGASTDGTVEAIQTEIERFRGRKSIRLIHQVEPDEIDETERQSGKMLELGKGHAVRKAFDAARGEVLMILDSDLTVPPESLPQFYEVLRDGHGEFVNGNRLVFPQEKQAMRLLNLLANRLFGLLFTYLLGQPITDTLCGTKVLRKRDYRKLVRHRSFFGDFDPFGDFDLLFGASRLNLKITEVFVRYRERSYGDIKIRRFRHGLLLARMSWIAFRRLKLKQPPRPAAPGS